MTSEEMVARSTLRSSYVHGFKTRARRVADQLRADTGHNDREPLDTSRVLSHLQLRRWRLSAFADQTAELWVAAAQLYVVDSSAFSGALIGEGDNRRCGVRAFGVDDDLWLAAFHHSDTRVRRAQVDADYFAHCLVLVPFSAARFRLVDPYPGVREARVLYLQTSG